MFWKDLWFLFAALFLLGYGVNRAVLRPTDPAAKRRVRRGLLVLHGLGVGFCLSFGLVDLIAGFDVSGALWSKGLAGSLSVLAIVLYLFAVSLLASYVFLCGGDGDMAVLHNHLPWNRSRISPRIVRFLVGGLCIIFSAAVALRALF